MATILVVDDERMLCDLLRATLSRNGHDVVIATGGREGLEDFNSIAHRLRCWICICRGWTASTCSSRSVALIPRRPS